MKFTYFILRINRQVHIIPENILGENILESCAAYESILKNNKIQYYKFYLNQIYGGGTFRRRRFGAADSAPPIRLWTTRRRAVSAPFPNLFLFFDLWRKNHEAGNFLNAVEREPVETRVLNPIAREASYKPKQRSYRKTNLKQKVLAPDSPGAEMSGAEVSSAETYPTRNVWCLKFLNNLFNLHSSCHHRWNVWCLEFLKNLFNLHSSCHHWWNH